MLIQAEMKSTQIIIKIRNYVNFTATDDINDPSCCVLGEVKMTDEKIKGEIISRTSVM